MNVQLWIALLVVAFWGGTLFERKWWRWHRQSQDIVIENWDLANDKTFVADVERAVLRHAKKACAEARVSTEDAKARKGTVV